jgi:hypothetical protein
MAWARGSQMVPGGSPRTGVNAIRFATTGTDAHESETASNAKSPSDARLEPAAVVQRCPAPRWRAYR